MKTIVSKNAKSIKFDKKRMKRYWRKVYPRPYADSLVGAIALNNITKVAKKNDLDGVVLKGKLKQAPGGFCYVDVPNSIIDAFYELIKGNGVRKPPYFTKEFNNIGAHISVMYASECEENGIEVKEVGEEIEFEIGEFFSVEPEGWDEMERVWFVQVKSPELSKIRERYGLSKKLNGHEFHITVATKKRK